MKKLMLVFGSACMAFSMVMAPVMAQTEYRGIIPSSSTAANNVEIQCQTVTQIKDEAKSKKEGKDVMKDVSVMNPAIKDDIGAKIHCGYVTLNDFPALVVYLIQWILTLAGGIAVIMIMVGGFQYMLGGVTDDKERGKKTLIYALGGLVVAFMAWWIVELVQVWITS